MRFMDPSEVLTVMYCDHSDSYRSAECQLCLSEMYLLNLNSFFTINLRSSQMDIKLQIILTTAQAVVMFNQGLINNTRMLPCHNPHTIQYFNLRLTSSMVLRFDWMMSFWSQATKTRWFWVIFLLQAILNRQQNYTDTILWLKRPF